MKLRKSRKFRKYSYGLQEITEDYWRLLGVYWRLLESTGDFCAL